MARGLSIPSVLVIVILTLSMVSALYLFVKFGWVKLAGSGGEVEKRLMQQGAINLRIKFVYLVENNPKLAVVVVDYSGTSRIPVEHLKFYLSSNYSSTISVSPSAILDAERCVYLSDLFLRNGGECYFLLNLTGSYAVIVPGEALTPYLTTGPGATPYFLGAGYSLRYGTYEYVPFSFFSGKEPIIELE